jgi:aspartyl-tRNA(Asn)/glutamyl-tRNA(Gln) amidotransferase subunit A
LTRTVEDAAIIMEVLSGQHPADPATVPVDVDYRGALDRSIEGMSVGYSENLGLFEVDDAVESVTYDATAALVDAGATVEEISLDHDLTLDELADAVGTTFAMGFLATAEAIEETFGFDLRERTADVSDSLLDLLAFADGKSVRDVAATGIPRTKLYDAVRGVFEEYDLLVTPLLTSPGMKLHAQSKTDWNRAMAWPFNVTGHPAASVPAGLTDGGLPVGLQIVGERYADADVLSASAAVERERPWDYLYER